MFKRLLAGLALAIAFVAPLHAQVSIPNTLVAGTTIRAGDLNTNFSTLGNHALDRLSGGTISGNITMDPAVTIDGIDLSVALCSSCAASFASVSTSGTITVGTNLSLTTPSTGITVNGVAIVNSSGKIPAISSTYFADLSGANITTLNGSNISSGTVGTARLGSGAADSTVFLRGDSTWATPVSSCKPVPTAKSTTYTAVFADFVEATGTFTVTLPAASAATSTCNSLDVKNVSTGTITVSRAGSDTIDGATSYSLNTQYQSVTLVTNAGGNGWNIR